MNDSLRQAVLDVIDHLLALQQESVRPREARTRLQPVRECYPDLEIDLLAEEQAFDKSVHYDALVRVPGEGTISLSYCHERAVPWPLRGVHRTNEADLVRVNTKILQVDAAMACLDFIWDQAPIIERLVNTCLIHEELERQPISLSDAELQEAMNRFRSAKKLFKAEDTLRWMERHGMTHEKLQTYVAETAIVPKLRDRIAEGHVEEYFRQHSSDFDSAWIARFEVPDRRKAGELAEQIRAGRQDFFAAADRALFVAAQRGVPAASLFAMIERRDAAAEFREQLFAAAPGQLVGPVQGDNGYALMRVQSVQRADLDDRTRASIKKVLFENWLTERRQAAQIEWCWGNASNTAPA
jgi:putative peptide maturation system protein